MRACVVLAFLVCAALAPLSLAQKKYNGPRPPKADVPFLLSAILVLGALYIRRRLQETPIFQAIKARGQAAKNTAEWAKWQKAAGTGKAVTIGHCNEAGNFLKAKIHQPDEQVGKPDQVYSVEMIERFGGLFVSGDMKDEASVRALLLFAKERQKSAAAARR